MNPGCDSKWALGGKQEGAALGPPIPGFHPKVTTQRAPSIYKGVYTGVIYNKKIRGNHPSGTTRDSSQPVS